MKVALAASAKLENQYIKEWVDHHRKFGFDNIILYDNNDEDTEKLIDVLSREVNEKYVIIDETYYNNKFSQIQAYNKLLEDYVDLYDYICVWDIDEFLYLKDFISIKDFLSSNDAFQYVNNICLFWETYGNNGFVEKPNISLVNAYDNIYNLSKDYHYNIFLKCIINCKNVIKNNLLKFDDAHQLSDNVNCCDTDGNNIFSSNCYIIPNLNHAYLKHFITKSLDEYINKIKRGLNWGKYDRFDMSIFKNVNGWYNEYENYLNYKLDNIEQSYRVCFLVTNYDTNGIMKHTYVNVLKELFSEDNFRYEYIDKIEYDNPNNFIYYKNVFKLIKNNEELNNYDIYVFINDNIYVNPYLFYRFIKTMYDKDTCYTDMLQSRFFSNSQLNERFFILHHNHIQHIMDNELFDNEDNNWWYGSYGLVCTLDTYDNINYKALGYIDPQVGMNNSDYNFKLNYNTISNIIYYVNNIDNIFKLHGFIVANKDNFSLRLFNFNFRHIDYNNNNEKELCNKIEYSDKFIKKC